jgi:galactose oxidase
LRRVATLGFVIALLPLVPGELSVGSAAAPTTPDSWTPTVTIRTPDGWYEAPIHATLLPDGRVMMIGVARPTWPATVGTATRRAAWILNPAAATDVLPTEMTPQQLTEPVDMNNVDFNGLKVNDDLFCAGSTLTSDGKVFIAGGTRSFTNNGAPVVVLGLPYDTSFDPATTTLSRVPGNMIVNGSTGTAGRWYPTVTRLPNGKMLIVGGFDRVISSSLGPVYNWSAETYDPATGQRSVAAPFGGMLKEAANPDYTQQWVLPYAGAARDLLVIGQADVPLTTNSASYSSWDKTAPMRPGAAGVTNPGFGQSSAMLELRVNNREFGYSNGTVLVTGGAMDSPLMRSADVYDPITKQWIASVDTGTERHHPSTITLPDGRVLVITGHNMDGDLGMLSAQYVDPMNGYSVTTGSSSMAQIRGYHTTSLLLPDGRVLIAGGRDASTSTSTEKPSLQYYSPDYMTKTRPVILGATSQIGFKQTFSIVTTGPKPKEAVLVSLGSMTHSFDENQRVVQLPVGAVLPGSNGTNVVIAGGPSDAYNAPPGYYMLFVLDQNRVPSAAQMVHIG